MDTVTRRATLDVPVDTAWAYFERPENWPQWDPDLVGVADSAEHGIVEGRTWDVEMRNPKKGTLEFSNVTKGREFTWRVVAMGGAVQGVARFRFEPTDDNKTLFDYEFGMTGIAGMMLWRFARSTVVKGVDGGMANIATYVGQQ